MEEITEYSVDEKSSDRRSEGVRGIEGIREEVPVSSLDTGQ